MRYLKLVLVLAVLAVAVWWLQARVGEQPVRQMEKVVPIDSLRT